MLKTQPSDETTKIAELVLDDNLKQLNDLILSREGLVQNDFWTPLHEDYLNTRQLIVDILKKNAQKCGFIFLSDYKKYLSSILADLIPALLDSSKYLSIQELNDYPTPLKFLLDSSQGLEAAMTRFPDKDNQQELQQTAGFIRSKD